MKPNRVEVETPRIFQAYCKRIVHYEACNAHKEIKQRGVREVAFSSLSPHEERELCTYDEYLRTKTPTLSISRANGLRQSCFPTLCTSCRRTNARPSCCITSLICQT